MTKTEWLILLDELRYEIEAFDALQREVEAWREATEAEARDCGCWERIKTRVVDDVEKEQG